MDRFDAMKTDSPDSSMVPLPNPASAAAPFTIFYAGKIRVYNAIPPEKAQAIMLIASAAAVAAKAYSGVGGSSAAVAAAELGPALTRSLSLQSSTVGEGALSRLQAELPIARRHSLKRFLEKRRDRLASKNAYALAKSSDSQTSKWPPGETLSSPDQSSYCGHLSLCTISNSLATATKKYLQ